MGLSIERVPEFIVLYDLIGKFLHPSQNDFIGWPLFHPLQDFHQFRGIICKLLSQINQKFLLKLPIVQPTLHMFNKVMYAFRAEFHNLTHLFILNKGLITFRLNFPIESRTKSRIITDFC
jgi:hypothetical protein